MTTKHRFFTFLLLLIGFLAIFDLFKAGMFLSHDGEAQVARVASFFTSMQQGNIIPRWAGNLNAGFGHPIFIFLYPLSSYLGAFVHFFGFSFIDSVKIVFGITFVFSGYFMYLWVKEFLGEEAGFVSGVLYMLAPYRFVDLYVRGAYGENTAFTFAPLVFLFILKTWKKHKEVYVVLGGTSLALLILAHNAISLMFMPLIFLYFAYLLVTSKNRRSFSIDVFLIIFFGFLIASFFWIPSLLEAKYTLRGIVIDKSYKLNFPTLFQLIVPSWGFGGSGGVSDGMSFQVGVIQWLFVLLSVFLVFVKSVKKRIFVIGSIVCFAGVIFLLLPISIPVWEKVTILQNFQFPWRFLTLTVFLSALLGGLVISAFPYKKFAVVLALVLLIFLNKDYWSARGYYQKDDGYFLNTYIGTTDTGESAPIWSIRGIDNRAKQPMDVVEGSASYKVVKKTFDQHEFTVEASGAAKVSDNTLYFPGWKVYVDGVKEDIEFQNTLYRGLITFKVPDGVHNVKVTFSESKIRLFSDILSLLGVSGVLIYWFFGEKILKRLYRPK